MLNTYFYFSFHFYRVLIPVLATVAGIPVGITSSAIGLKVCVITAGIKEYK